MKIKYSNEVLRRIGDRCVEIILERTAQGRDATGKPFPPYSTKPFAMPAGAVQKGVRVLLKKQGKLSYFKRNGKSLWVVIQGGYLELKRVQFRKTEYTGKPNLMATGKMLRSFRVVSVGNNKIILGFNRTEEAEKALWNAERGRNMLGISQEDFRDEKMKELLKNIAIDV